MGRLLEYDERLQLSSEEIGQFCGMFELAVSTGNFGRAQQIVLLAYARAHENRGDRITEADHIIRLGLNPRDANSMEGAGLYTIRDLLDALESGGDARLLAIREFGPTSVRNTRRALVAHGFLQSVNGEPTRAAGDHASYDRPSATSGASPA